VSKEEFKLEFVADDTGKAVLVGNMGVSDVDLHVGSYGVTFMKKLETDVVQTTTIASAVGTRIDRRCLDVPPTLLARADEVIE
jgi:hypothetical protein